MAATQTLLLGVDGGGTKTVAWLAVLRDDGTWTKLGEGAAGPGNPRAAGFETARTNLESAIDSAFVAAGRPREHVAAACFALAGTGRAADRERVETWAYISRIARQILVTTDVQPLLAVDNPDGSGVALVCGTGSLAWGRNAAGEDVRCGGWGYLLGDEGSGYALALAGLRAAMRSADGRGPSTALLSAFQSRLEAADAGEIVAAIYQPETTRERIAALADVIFEQAEQEDAAAQSILAAGAENLAEMIQTVAQRLHFAPHDYRLALAGGVVLGRPKYGEMVLQKLEEQGLPPAEVVAIPQPVAGAVALAARLAVNTGQRQP